MSLTADPRPATARTGAGPRVAVPAGRGGRDDLWTGLVAVAFLAYCVAAVDEDVFGAMSFGRVSRFAAAALIAAVCLRAIGPVAPGSAPRVNPTMVALYVIATLSLLSMVWSIAPARSETTSFTLVSVMLATAAALSALRWDPQRSRRLLELGLVIGALFAAAAAIRGHFTGEFIHYAGDQRAAAGAADPNDIALAMAVTLPVFLASPRRWVRVAVTPVVIAILYTGSRGGVVAGVVGLLLYAVFTARFAELRQRLRRSSGSFGAMSIVVVVLVAVPLLLTGALSSRLGSTFSSIEQGNLNGRTELWSTAWATFSRAPLLGTGSGTVRVAILERTGVEAPAHDVVLQFLAELGIVGGVLVVGAMVLAIRRAWHLRAAVPWLFPAVVSLVVGTAALSWDRSKLFWLLLAVPFALHDDADPAPAPSRAEVPRATPRGRARSVSAARRPGSGDPSC